MDPSVRRDPELEGSAQSLLPQPAPAGPRPRLPAHPSASEPVHHFERVQTLPHRPAARPASPEYSWAPARVASNRPDGQPRHERGCSPLRHPQQPPSPRRPSPERREHYQRGEGGKRSPARPRSPRRPSPRGQAGQRSPRARSPAQRSPRRSPATRGRGSPGRRWDSGRREQSPPRPHSAGSGGRRGWRKGGGRGGNGNQPDPALDHAADTFVEVVRQARASGAPTHVHIEVTNGPPFAADPGQVAPLRAPTLREYQAAREGRAQFRTPRQVPGFSAPRLAVGRTPGWPAAFPREAQTAPLPTRAGRDPMLTMCRVLNLAEACEVVANLQLAVCGATRSFPSSFGPGTRGSCLLSPSPLPSHHSRSLPSIPVALALSHPFPSLSLSPLPSRRSLSLSPLLSVALAFSPPFSSLSLSPLPPRRSLKLSPPFPSLFLSSLPSRRSFSRRSLPVALSLSWLPSSCPRCTSPLTPPIPHPIAFPLATKRPPAPHPLSPPIACLVAFALALQRTTRALPLSLPLALLPPSPVELAFSPRLPSSSLSPPHSRRARFLPPLSQHHHTCPYRPLSHP
ncbi:unnamed protein product [Closterium sp. NIES-65]|nr:unnamed protein product [Closterium sp. NIES-65]